MVDLRVYSCQDKGSMSNEGFLTLLRHFVDFYKPTKEETVVLILDGHVIHTKNLAREAGVVIVSVPPQTTHRKQPLDVAFFGPFGKYCDDALRMWMKEHVGRPVKSCTRAQPYATSDNHCCSSIIDSCCHGSCTRVMPAATAA